MPDLFDYLSWRGDLSLEQAPFCPVDGLILSVLSYVHLDGLVPAGPSSSVPLGRTAADYLALPASDRGRCRCEKDLDLLRALAAAPRFAAMELTCGADRFVPEEQLQFAALTVLPGDGTAFLAFRGTDATLVGWKEDFNMSFLDVVPAQREAARYAAALAAAFPGPLRLGGHSKGGNLATFAAALCPMGARDRIRAVYSFDGPGHTAYLLAQPGYQELLTRIHTYVPQSSVVGMLLEHEGPYTVVRSDQAGLLQHDPYSWQVSGGDFVRLDEVTAGSRMVDRALKDWLAGLTPAERETVADTLYGLLSAGDAALVEEALRPQNLAASLRALKRAPGRDLLTLTASLGRLIAAAARAVREPGGEG